METEGEECIAAHQISGMSTEELRNMMEAVFKEGKTKVIIYTDKQGEVVKNKGKKTYALIVERKPGTNLEKDVMDIRNSVKNEKGNKEIRGVSTTKEGKILVSIGEKKEVTMRGPGQNRKIIHIRGMDMVTRREEVKEALRERLEDLMDKEFSLGDMRNNRGDTQAVTLVIGKERAEQLMERRVEIERCYRCWGMDHLARDCVGIDRSKCCFACGEEGHRRNECKRVEKCIVCNVTGHRTGTGRCEAFRRALTRARKKEKEGRQ
ncbi:uncharacterized protein [Euwallacea fornicatus]|uniref:uncharacterized protein n=1 Tax=Euwallacea fornicatus TaxID=995702 RepID=UPI00338F627D